MSSGLKTDRKKAEHFIFLSVITLYVLIIFIGFKLRQMYTVKLRFKVYYYSYSKPVLFAKRI